MKHIEKLRDMLCDELDNIASQNELTAGSLETVDKLAHAIKCIDTIVAMKDAGYSQEGGSYGNSYGNSYDYSGRRRRNAMGQFSRNGTYAYDDGRSYANRRYSRDDARDNMISQLEELMENAPSEKYRQKIHEWMEQMERE